MRSALRHRRSWIALAGALWLAAAAGSPALTAKREAPLALRASALVWSSSRLAFRLEQKGVLAGKRLAVFVFVDGNMVGRVDTNGSVTTAAIDELVISTGKHLLMVKAGTIEARAEFRRLSPLYPAGALVALTAAILLARRRRSS